MVVSAVASIVVTPEDLVSVVMPVMAVWSIMLAGSIGWWCCYASVDAGCLGCGW